MDGGGITGLRLFCSALTDAAHSSEKVIEFPGSFGNWGERIVCAGGKWAEKFWLQFATKPSEHLGVVRMRLICNAKGGKAQIVGGLTKDPTLWQHGLAEGDPALSKWEEAIDCPDFVTGVKVQTDQNNSTLSRPSEGNRDMVGINKIQFACNIYGGLNLRINQSRGK